MKSGLDKTDGDAMWIHREDLRAAVPTSRCRTLAQVRLSPWNSIRTLPQQPPKEAGISDLLDAARAPQASLAWLAARRSDQTMSIQAHAIMQSIPMLALTGDIAADVYRVAASATGVVIRRPTAFEIIRIAIQVGIEDSPHELNALVQLIVLWSPVDKTLRTPSPLDVLLQRDGTDIRDGQ